MLEALHITKKYGQLQVLKGVSLSLQSGEMVSITGSSGAGKSTLLHILGTLDKPDSGTLQLNGHALHTLSSKKLAAVRNQQLGFIFQFHHLLPEFSALENVCIPAYINGRSHSEASRAAIQLLERMGLGERMKHKPMQLSGGEQQRVAIARALINKPALVLADEPTGNLDSANALELHKLFAELSRELNQGFLIVTHNEELARLSHRRIHMRDGAIVQA